MTIQQSVPDYAAARQAMVDSQLRPQGVNDPLVVQAMGSVAREQFVPEQCRPLAYLDRAVPLGDGRSLPPAAAIGQLLTAMALQRGQSALVVGTDPGYAAAVLEAMGLDVTATRGPIEKSHMSGGTYDAILIDDAVEQLPGDIVNALSDGGTIGFASLDRGIFRLTVGRKSGGALGLRSIADNTAVPGAGVNRPRAFTF